ncbi:MAG: hypothetical protein JWP78_417, partial [Mucilaginibacter sp.]|nr:hypothetical protein [Mucilaginibacter sp.]
NFIIIQVHLVKARCRTFVVMTKPGTEFSAGIRYRQDRNITEIHNDILATKLEQCIDAFNKFSTDSITSNIKTVQENTKESKALQEALKRLKIPEEVVSTVHHKYEHKHLNEGVRFALVTVIAVILITSSISAYFYNRYTEVKGFERNYEIYKKNNEWEIAYFNYMYRKHLKESNSYIDIHPFPK